MKIAHVGTSMTLNEVVLNQMIHQLEQGHEVFALCNEDHFTPPIIDAGVTVIPASFVRHDAVASLRAAATTWRMCRHLSFDVVHTHNTLPGIVGRIVARLAGTPAVVHTCHAWPLGQLRGWLVPAVLRAMETLAAKAAHAVLFQNEDDMNDCVRLKIVPPSKATLIGNGIDVEGVRRRQKPDARFQIRREFGIDDNAFVVVCLARLEPPKGHDFLLEALQRLVAAGTERQMSVLFVGDGPSRDALEEKSRSLELNHMVQFTGYRNDVSDVLAAADMSVLTSRFEGLPRALMESMALGLPCVATDVPGTRALIESGKTGLLVRHGDAQGFAEALLQVMEDGELAARLGQSGRHLVETEFSEDLVVGRILQVYEDMLNGHRKPPFHSKLTT